MEPFVLNLVSRGRDVRMTRYRELPDAWLRAPMTVRLACSGPEDPSAAMAAVDGYSLTILSVDADNVPVPSPILLYREASPEHANDGKSAGPHAIFELTTADMANIAEPGSYWFLLHAHVGEERIPRAAGHIRLVETGFPDTPPTPTDPGDPYLLRSAGDARYLMLDQDPAQPGLTGPVKAALFNSLVAGTPGEGKVPTLVSGVPTWTASGSGTPGGSSGQPQYNNGGAFAGFTGLTIAGGALQSGSFAGNLSTAGTLTIGGGGLYPFQAELDTSLLTNDWSYQLPDGGGTLVTSGALSTKADLVGGKLDVAQLPDLAISAFLGAVANEAAMLALVGQRGDWCQRTDLGTNWIVVAEPSSLIGSWRQMSYPGSAVVSVAGRTGAVTLTTSDIGGLASALAGKSDTSHGHPVVTTLVDGFMSTLMYDKLDALQTRTELDTELSNKADLVGGKLAIAQVPDIAIAQFLGSVADESAMLALAGETSDWCIRTDLGTVWVLTGPDPTMVGDWTQLAYPTAPVTSVAGKTGTVTLVTSDVDGLDAALAGKALSSHQHSTSDIISFVGEVRTAAVNAMASGTGITVSPSGSGVSRTATFNLKLPTTGEMGGVKATTRPSGQVVVGINPATGDLLFETPPSGGGSPGGTDGQVQYRVNSTTFGGVTGLTLNSGVLRRATFTDDSLGATPSPDTVLVQNSTPASAGSPQASPRTTRKGSVWRTTGGAADLEISDYVSVLENGDNPYLRWCVDGRVGGGAWGNIFQAQRYLGLSQIRVPGTGASWAPQLVMGASVGFFTLNHSTDCYLAMAGNTWFSWNGDDVSFTIGTSKIRWGFAAGSLVFGSADAAAPVAQTLSVQNVSAGTSNTAGVNWTFNASRGTGTGVGGDILFQVATATTAGSTQNPLVEAFRIRQDRAVFVANVSAEPPTPTGGGIFYVEAGALKFKGSSGTVTTVAPA